MAASTLTLPQPKTWDVTEFHKLRESGLWDGRRMILLHGTLWDLGPIKPPHAVAVTLVHHALTNVFGAAFHIRTQLPLVLNLQTDPRPDLAVVAGHPRDYAYDHPSSAELVVEIADSSLALDRHEKRTLYATAAVPDYWILDLNGRRLLVYRDPAPAADGGSEYTHEQILAPDETITPLAVPDRGIAVAELLP